MRKRLADLLAAIMVLPPMAAAPAAAVIVIPPDIPVATFCILVDVNLGPLGEQSARETVVLPEDLTEVLVPRFAKEGPCNDGGGGGNGGGGNGGGGNGGGSAAPLEITQDFEQESESGDIDQSFTVAGGDDNGSQCANVTGEGNTGNLQNTTGSLQFASDIEEIEQEDIGSDLSVSGTSTVTCEQQVNQAAAAG